MESMRLLEGLGFGFWADGVNVSGLVSLVVPASVNQIMLQAPDPISWLARNLHWRLSVATAMLKITTNAPNQRVYSRTTQLMQAFLQEEP